MLLGLAAVSSQGLWIITSSDATRAVASLSWSETDSTTLSSRITPSLHEVLALGNIQLKDISGLFCVSGPGAFTGLRMGGAYMQGLARALDVPLRAVPTFDLLGKPFFLPLRHQLTRTLDLPESLAKNVEFLELGSATSFTVKVPDATSICWGLKDKTTWPSIEELRTGMQKNLTREPGLQIEYGLTPKISGQRE